MNLASRLKKQKLELRISIEQKRDLQTIYENLELVRIYLELLDGEDNPSPIKAPGTTRDIFGKNFTPPKDQEILDRVAREIRTNIDLYLLPNLTKQSVNEYELPFSRLRCAMESIRIQIERWLILSALNEDDKPRTIKREPVRHSTVAGSRAM